MSDDQWGELKKLGFEISDCLLGKNDQVVGWLCSYVPEEIIHAAGFQPMRIRGEGDPIRKADGLLHNNMCPFVRSVMDDAVEGRLGHLSGMVFANSCDAMRRLYDAWSVFLEKETIFYLDPPKSTDDLSVAYYAEQLGGFAEALNRYGPKEVNAASLARSIRVYNETRALMKEVSSLASKTLLSGHALFDIMQLATLCDREKFNRRLGKFLDGFSGKRMEGEGVRILLAGCIIDQTDQIRLMEEAGALVVANELCTAGRQFDSMVQEEGDPFHALAERYLKKAPCARMMNLRERIEYLVQLAEENNVDGVIYHIIKFCDHFMWDLPVVRDAFKAKGIPVLDVEGEYVKGTFGPLQTRIQAFVESLRD